MKRRLAPLALACLAPLLIGAEKPVLVPDISARQVQIRYSFTGAQLLLFGAVVYPGGRAPAGTRSPQTPRDPATPNGFEPRRRTNPTA